MDGELFQLEEEQVVNDGPVPCLGITFENDEKRREFFRNELRKKLPELRLIEGFPIGTDDDIIALSDHLVFDGFWGTGMTGLASNMYRNTIRI